jgi:hypothetical protein
LRFGEKVKIYAVCKRRTPQTGIAVKENPGKALRAPPGIKDQIPTNQQNCFRLLPYSSSMKGNSVSKSLEKMHVETDLLVTGSMTQAAFELAFRLAQNNDTLAPLRNP